MINVSRVHHLLQPWNLFRRTLLLTTLSTAFAAAHADTLDNIWPQCGPPNTVLVHRYFKEKDAVENYLAKQVRDGVMDLKEVQQGIASDWTQYLAEAKKACPMGKCQ